MKDRDFWDKVTRLIDSDPDFVTFPLPNAEIRIAKKTLKQLSSGQLESLLSIGETKSK